MIYLEELIVKQALFFLSVVAGDINHGEYLLDLIVLAETMLLVFDTFIFFFERSSAESNHQLVQGRL